MMYRSLWVAIGIVVAFSQPVLAESPPFRVMPTLGADDASDHYCGLYCVYQAGKLTGQPVDLDRLIRPEYLRGEYGSTPADLIASCREFGIHSTFIPITTYADAILMDGPIIVLIKNSPESPKANHWVMILKADGDSAELYYPSVGVIRVPAAELQSLWGGPALIVLRADEGWETKTIWVAVKVAMIAALLGLTYLTLRLVSRLRLHPMVTLVAATVVLATAAHTLDPAGFVHNRRILSTIERLREPRTPPELEPTELLNSRAGFLVVDTRTPGQFQGARIPGAINIPISASHWRNERILTTIPRDSHIVVYCNSESCPWAAALAKSSLLQEFPKVSILSGGIEGYVAGGGKLERGQPSAKGTE